VVFAARIFQEHMYYKAVLRSRSQEPMSRKLAPGSGAEITNCDSGSSSGSCSGSFLFTTDLKNFYRKKIMVTEKVFVKCYYNCNLVNLTAFLVGVFLLRLDCIDMGMQTPIIHKNLPEKRKD
jgi:hypothetical protein